MVTSIIKKYKNYQINNENTIKFQRDGVDVVLYIDKDKNKISLSVVLELVEGETFSTEEILSLYSKNINFTFFSESLALSGQYLKNYYILNKEYSYEEMDELEKIEKEIDFLLENNVL